MRLAVNVLQLSLKPRPHVHTEILNVNLLEINKNYNFKNIFKKTAKLKMKQKR